MLGLLLLTGVGCRSAAFSFATTQPPRVSVVHRPLNPQVAEEIVIEARAEAPPGRRVAELRIDFFRPVPDPPEGERSLPAHLEAVCEDLETCRLTVPAGSAEGRAFYTASMTDDLGRKVNARSGFGFLIGRPREEVFPLREPVNLLVDDSVFKILLVRDEETYPTS
ncbi:MAG: hypothetical protein KDD47_02555, partial [Acidobacteria bacterium]|nr:hypothetical protein [Acidobacteriota bacterium]